MEAVLDILSNIIPLIAAAAAIWAACASSIGAKAAMKSAGASDKAADAAMKSAGASDKAADAADKAAEYSLQASKQTVYVNAITTERIKWLNNLKSLAAEYLVGLRSFPNLKTVLQSENIEEKKEDYVAKKDELEILRKRITFQLNHLDEYESLLITELEESLSSCLSISISNNDDTQKKAEEAYKFGAHIDKLEHEFQVMFKIEWERIKKEASGQVMSDKDANTIREKYAWDPEKEAKKKEILMRDRLRKAAKIATVRQQKEELKKFFEEK